MVIQIILVMLITVKTMILDTIQSRCYRATSAHIVRIYIYAKIEIFDNFMITSSQLHDDFMVILSHCLYFLNEWMNLNEKEIENVRY